MALTRLVAAGAAVAMLTTSIVLPAAAASATEPGTTPRSSPSIRVASSPFTCAPVFFQSAVRDDSSAYQRLYEYSPTTNRFVGLGSNQPNVGTQVLGYNTADNYIYELVRSFAGVATTMDLLRVDGGGTYSYVNRWSVPGIFNVGDFWYGREGTYLVAGGDFTNDWRLIDVTNDDSSTPQSPEDFIISGSGSCAFKGKDITILGNTGYGLHDDTLYVLNLDTRRVSTKPVTFSEPRGGGSDGFGSAYADALGNLYFFENSTSKVWRLPAEDVNQAAPTLDKVGSGPAYVSGTVGVTLQKPNDGASCPDAPSPYSATITGETATSVTDDTATLTANVNPHDESTTATI